MKIDQTKQTSVLLRRRRYQTGDHWTLGFRYNKDAIAKAKAAGGSWSVEHGLSLIPTSARSYASMKQMFGPDTVWDDRTSVAERLPVLENSKDKSLQTITTLWPIVFHVRIRTKWLTL